MIFRRTELVLILVGLLLVGRYDKILDFEMICLASRGLL